MEFNPDAAPFVPSFQPSELTGTESGQSAKKGGGHSPAQQGAYSSSTAYSSSKQSGYNHPSGGYVSSSKGAAGGQNQGYPGSGYGGSYSGPYSGPPQSQYYSSSNVAPLPYGAGAMYPPGVQPSFQPGGYGEPYYPNAQQPMAYTPSWGGGYYSSGAAGQQGDPAMMYGNQYHPPYANDGSMNSAWTAPPSRGGAAWRGGRGGAPAYGDMVPQPRSANHQQQPQSSNISSEAPPYYPGLQKPSYEASGNSLSPQLGAAAVATKDTHPATAWAPTPENPVVAVFLGIRGSGKTTQSKLLAEHFNLLHVASGDLARAGKNPVLALKEIVEENFGTGVTRKYNGLSLDRFIALSTNDAYYTQWALDSVGLPVPEVFFLSIDFDAAKERAEQREESKQSMENRRTMEYRVQFTVSEEVYGAAGVLHRMNCDPVFSPEVIHERVKCELQKAMALRCTPGKKPLALATPLLCDNSKLPMITDMSVYDVARRDVHVAIGNANGRHDNAPLSVVGGYVSESTFDTRHKRDKMATYFVTLKADGERFLVAKHKVQGYLAFPQNFMCCYRVDELFKEVPATTPSSESGADADASDAAASPVDVILDCELIPPCGPKKSFPQVCVLDYVYFYGSLARNEQFGGRLDKLRAFLGGVSSASPVRLKEYETISEIGKLRELQKKGSFEVDGLIFQPNARYRYGADENLLKWKPMSQCTVDCRLCDAEEDAGSGMWRFQLYVQDPTDKLKGEVHYSDAYVLLPYELVDSLNISDGTIAEMLPQHAGPTPKTAENQWEFVRVRPDKAYPNKISIVDEMCNMKHLTYDALIATCSKIPVKQRRI